MSRYELWLCDDGFNRLHLLDEVIDFSYLRVANGVGQFTITLPGTFDLSWILRGNELARDRIIQIWRAPTDGRLALERSYFLRKRITSTDDNGLTTTVISGPDLNDLIARRIVAYAAGTAQAEQTDAPDDMAKVIVRQNLGASATAARNWTANGLSVAADLSQGTSLTMGFSWEPALDTLGKIADASATATAIYWDMVQPTPSTVEFRTTATQPGTDRTWPGGVNPVVLALEYGNLARPQLEEDASEEVTYVYAGGQGEGSDRTIVEVSDSARLNASKWNRREAFADARNESTTDGVTAVANAALQAGRPRRKFTAQIVESPQTRYGIDWQFGDKLSARYYGQYDAIVKAVSVKVDKAGAETIDAKLEVDDVG